MKTEMKKKIKLKDLILPNKKLNYFVGTILLLGILSGSIFLMLSSQNDQTSVIRQIELFFTNISKNSIDNGLAFRNSLIVNYLFILLIWGFGFSMIFVIFTIFIAYIKGFLVGFSISSIFLTYHLKGIVGVLLYAFPTQLFNLLIVFLLTVYSLMFSNHLIKVLLSKKGNQRSMLKKYFVILMFCIILSFLSSVLEVYVFPRLLKLVISIYIS